MSQLSAELRSVGFWASAKEAEALDATIAKQQSALETIAHGYQGQPEVKLTAGMMQKIAREALK